MDNGNNRISRRRLLAGSAGAAGAAVAVSVAGCGGTAAAAEGTTAGSVPGPVTVTPDDPRYPDLVRGVDQRWAGTPESVRVVFTAQQVVDVVQEAVSNRKRLTVRSGGHCYQDFVFNPDVDIVIDTTEMSSVYHDPARGAFAVEPGATLLNVHTALYKGWGVALPAGICYSVGAGGHVCGGGWGLLCRRNGLVVDYLEAVEVVVVDAAGRARLVVASRDPADPNHDLWWAHTGGGGGSFGVVTRFWFRAPGVTGDDPARLLPRPPSELLFSAVSWPWKELDEQKFATLLRNWGDFFVANSDPGGPFDPLCSFLNLNHVSDGQIDMLTSMDAGVPNAEGRLRQFLAAVSDNLAVAPIPVTSDMHGPLAEFLTPQRWGWLKLSRYLGTGHIRIVDPALRGTYKSAYHRKNYTPAQIGTLYRQLNSTDEPNPTAVAQITSYGGQVNAMPRTATAQVHRDSKFKVLYEAHWSRPADDTANVTWLRGFYRQLYQDTGGVPVSDDRTDGCYINYCDADLSDPAQNKSGVPYSTLYWGENYPRLQRVKARWDPRNFFFNRQSIRLP